MALANPTKHGWLAMDYNRFQAPSAAAFATAEPVSSLVTVVYFSTYEEFLSLLSVVVLIAIATVLDHRFQHSVTSHLYVPCKGEACKMTGYRRAKRQLAP